MKYTITILAVLLMTGCASDDYARYTTAHAQMQLARSNAEAARYKALSDIANSGDSKGSGGYRSDVTEWQHSIIPPDQRSEEWMGSGSTVGSGSSPGCSSIVWHVYQYGHGNDSIK